MCDWLESDSCNYIDRDSLGNIVDLRNFLQNAGTYEVEGIDFFTAYRFPETSFGSFKASLDLAYVLGNKFDGEDRAGIQYGDGGFPELKGSLNVDWAMGDWDAHWKTRYVGPMDNTLHVDDGYVTDDGITERFDAYMVHNISVGYNIDAYNTKVSLGINNLLLRNLRLKVLITTLRYLQTTSLLQSMM